MHTLDEFKERCWEAEILLLDDVQYLGGKAATQEVFYGILKTRCESTKLTVHLRIAPMRYSRTISVPICMS